MPDTVPWFERLNGWSGALAASVGVVTAVISVFTNMAAHRAETSANEAKKAAETRVEMRQVRGEERDWTLKVFEKAYAALESERLSQQEAALALVISLDSGQTRDGLISAFRRAAVSEVKAQAEEIVAGEAQFTAQKASDERARIQTNRPTGQAVGADTIVLANNTTGYDVDVFWCGGGDQASARLDKAMAVGNQLSDISRDRQLIAGQRLGRIRVRLLPESTNATPNYRYASNVVSYDPDIPEKPEKPVADAISDLASRTLANRVTAEATPSGTAWYLSFFICGAV